MTSDRSGGRLPGLGGNGKVRRVRRGFDAQLTAQRRLGHLEPIDDGLIALGRTLADAIDDEHSSPDGSTYTVGHVAAKLLPVILALRGEARDLAGDGLDVELERLRAEIRDAARARPPDDG